MLLNLANITIDLDRVDLVLGLNAVPTLRLLTEERFDEDVMGEVVSSGERATLEWQDDSVEVLPYGFDRSNVESRRGEAFVYALLLTEELESWFGRKVEAGQEILYGIYQNQSEVGGWTFLNNCLGRQFLVPSDEYRERIDQILPISTCLTRPIRQDNQQYLHTVIGYLQQHLPELVGWTGVHAESEPLRFVFFDEEHAVSLDESWWIAAGLPVRFAPMREQGRNEQVSLRKTGAQVAADKKMAFLKELASHGIQTPLAGFLEVGDETSLLYLPGPVKLGKKLLLCERVSYSFDATEDALTTTLELGSGFQVPAGSAFPVRLEGLFKAWDQDDKDEVRVFLSPPSDSSWRLMAAADSDLLKPDAELMAEFVLPTTPKDKYSELYVRRVEGDRVVFELQPFLRPIIYGSQQVLNEQLEAATVSLNTEILALSLSDRNTAIEDANGIVMDSKQMMNRAENDMFTESETIIFEDNLVVTEKSVDVKSKTNIANDVQIDGKLEVGGM